MTPSTLRCRTLATNPTRPTTRLAAASADPLRLPKVNLGKYKRSFTQKVIRLVNGIRVLGATCLRELPIISIYRLSEMNHRLSQSITGTVTASASVEVRSIEAASDSTALYFAAKSTTTVANGKLQQTSASRANGLTTCRTSSRTKSTAPCSVTRPSEPIRTVGEMRTG